MKYKAIIFDFNGTLLWDTHLHNQAWDRFLAKYGFNFSDHQKNQIIHGKQNQDIFKELFKQTLSDAEIEQYVLEKEHLYQELCLEEQLPLGPGVEAFLDRLKQQNVPFTIATSSGIENVSFYFEHYDLKRWFSLDSIVYNNGKIKSKPSPDIFLVAMEKLGCTPEQAIVFEDSRTGILSAQAANSGKVIVVNSIDGDYSEYGLDVITHFDQFDMALLG